MLLRPHEDQTGKAMGIVMSAFVSLAVLMMAVDAGRLINDLLPPFKTEPVRLISIFTPELKVPEPAPVAEQEPKVESNTETQQEPSAVAPQPVVPSEGQSTPVASAAVQTTATVNQIPQVNVAGMLGVGLGDVNNVPPTFGLHPVRGSGGGTTNEPSVFGDTPDGEYTPVENMPEIDMGALMRAITYPEVARRSRVEGTVYMRVLVGVEGQVERVQVVHSDHPSLEKEATRAAKKAVFTPGNQNGVAVKVWMVIPVKFQL